MAVMTSAVYPRWNLATGFPFPRPAAGLTLCSHLPGHVTLSEAHHLSTSHVLAGETGLTTAWPSCPLMETGETAGGQILAWFMLRGYGFSF